ncbi:glycine betaine/L-proline transport ATP binding subunit [Acididesulfobacillus acetoxydans]|uniref:Quaternary amine transport ATP-binding protein n=1 Tax=Acididesulfobacillus acetoxydans TaxID=1561005 RepID=A0A8S0W2D5_9FIRM|nr:glycine betaine/L-proline transport ATP binding subunit [Acididesulfobacillus acetoxydans]CEJ09409.1 Choline transport ATP-binding protein OpuBA [Acididesulfobacillus acetoxydans]
MLIGPSGCGKSTTLRMINRLVEPSSGTIEIDGQDYEKYHPVELRRRLGYVIQQVGLIPHLTIGENISFVLRLKGVKENGRRARARELLELVEMKPDLFMDRYPSELSGGQQQRIGVLRALAHDPDIILMDEPFGSLDPIMREQLQDELKRLQLNVQKTIIFVTHDMDEAIRMADRIVIMKEGRIVQVASPHVILQAPSDDFVANFFVRQRLAWQTIKIPVREIMSRSMATIPHQSSLAHCLEEMLRQGSDQMVILNEHDKFEGFICLEDLKGVSEQGLEMPVNVFPKVYKEAIPPEFTLLNGIQAMIIHKINAIPVTESDGTVVGSVSLSRVMELLRGAAGTSVVAPATGGGENGDPALEKEVKGPEC